jgi:hypothetical protein
VRTPEQIGLAGGKWVPRRGVLVWTPDSKGNRRAINVHDLIACPTCRARVDEVCRTETGHSTKPHASRLAPRLCPCGANVRPQATYCHDCAREEMRRSKRDYLRRRRADRRDAA